MKKFLLPDTGKFYKANLHCHSTLSDGKFSPEEIKQLYMEKGYSIVAYTDHNLFIPHPELCDENFLALNGFEAEVNETVPPETPFRYIKTCHICFVALDPTIEFQPMWHRSKYLFGNAVNHRDEVKFDETQPDYEREYAGDKISEMMRIGREKGFFVTYNHPAWSAEEYPQYMSYDGMNAMEVMNHASYVGGYPEHNERVYDDMLRGGKKIYCLATDDNHSFATFFGGFVMIKSDKLEYGAIADALSNGNFYASEGPEIKSLWYEDSKVYVECSGAREIYIVKGIRTCKMAKAEETLLTSAEFNVNEDDVYFRIVVVGPDGKKAYTNAYFVDEL